jgi:hypothetical protein
MAPRKKKEQIYLANNWPISKVKACLRQRGKKKLAKFVEERFQERYFEPIKSLKRASGKKKHYGFAMMSICSLLVEALECYQLGLPFTGRRRIKELRDRKRYPRVQKSKMIPKNEARDGREVFVCFFCENANFFPGVDGDTFYREIRNGLLHQAQTTGGWRIKKDQKVLWNVKDSIIDRNRFATQLQSCFDYYLRQIRNAKRNQPIYSNFERKIWWLVYLSEPH